jgi:hypothetical protein
MVPTVHADSTSTSALSPAPAGRPLEFLEARQFRTTLKQLLGREQAAMAEFLVQARTWVTFWNRDMGDSSLRLR